MPAVVNRMPACCRGERAAHGAGARATAGDRRWDGDEAAGALALALELELEPVLASRQPRRRA